MKHRSKRFLGILLGLVLVLGLLPGLGLTAYAGTETYTNLIPDEGDNLSDKTVYFHNRPWYIIMDNSTGANEGTVRLLAADTSFGYSKFHDDYYGQYPHLC